MLTENEELAANEAIDYLRQALHHAKDRETALHYVSMAASCIDVIEDEE